MRLSRIETSLGILLASIALLAGCDCGGPPVGACTSTANCSAGQVCIDGMCRMRTDSGPSVGDTSVAQADAPTCIDVDRDGHFAISAGCPAGDDCNDAEASVYPGQAERCGDGVDNNCTAGVDEPGCRCDIGQTVSCYSGPPATQGRGVCHPGVAVCEGVGLPGACRGEQVPLAAQETACDRIDEDCDGMIDEGLRNACGVCGTEPLMELCGDNVDNDCDGSTDEECDCDAQCQCMGAVGCTCTAPTNQPCYEGLPQTQGQGLCRGGRRSCVGAMGAARWQTCEGQQLPTTECGPEGVDSLDQDCDGLVDEGCLDADADGAFWPADCDDSDAAVRPGGVETCNGRDDTCNGVADEGVTNSCGLCGPTPAEVCGNGRDEDCDGTPDDGCTCTANATIDCFLGPAATEGVGRCRAGRMMCRSDEFAMWGPCEGAVGPIPEICNGEDDDCDGQTDERWAAGSNACGYCNSTEVCDDADNDCDGRVDEYVANRCGECGVEPTEVCDGADNDCDGVIDDGVTNSCGLCAPMPCYTQSWPDPSSCSAPGRTCDGVVADETTPTAITLGESRLMYDHIYIAVTNLNQVAQLDTTNGNINWTRPSFGTDPSRTAVAIDGSVWVGNRGFGDPNNPAISNMVHLDVNGNLICRADVTGLIRGVAIDAEGNVWAGAYNGQQVFRVSGTAVDTSMNPPRCQVLNTIPVAAAVYGLAADPDGFIWTSSSPDSVRISVATQTIANRAPNPWYYGIAADGAGRMWFGGWGGGGPIHSIDRTTLARTDTGIGAVTAVTVHPDGRVWGTQYSLSRLVRYDPATGAAVYCPYGPSGGNAHGVAVDRAGRAWGVALNGYVNVFNNDDTCSRVAEYPVSPGNTLYSYSDMTGHLLRTFTAPEGHWLQVFDSGYVNAYWNRSSWMATVPPNTSVELTVRASDTTDFSASTACGPFTTSPADLSSCNLGRHRYLQTDVRLRSTRSGSRPIVYSVDARWAY